ncbi:Uncharacterised protein [Yersinia nurmii]|uniref:Uncharacterized protein n=1 Tax=Yersinia nurmii TaxID=685706 RepID=A0ABP1Y7N2_9GAMM|nr:Uncharacterised protein [Yersinia nurmii]
MHNVSQGLKVKIQKAKGRAEALPFLLTPNELALSQTT